MKSYAIADVDLMPRGELFARIGRLSRAGVDMLQLRAKRLDDRSLYELAITCRGLVSGPTRFLVNGRVDVAAAVGADGVHLPSNGLPASAVRAVIPEQVIGVSCHSVEDCRKACRDGADYVLLGSVFEPRSKAGEGRVTMEELREAAGLGVEVYALGGLSMSNLHHFRNEPLAGIAAISLWMTDEPLESALEEVRAL